MWTHLTHGSKCAFIIFVRFFIVLLCCYANLQVVWRHIYGFKWKRCAGETLWCVLTLWFFDWVNILWFFCFIWFLSTNSRTYKVDILYRSWCWSWRDWTTCSYIHCDTKKEEERSYVCGASCAFQKKVAVSRALKFD